MSSSGFTISVKGSGLLPSPVSSSIPPVFPIHRLTGICAGLHRPDGSTTADKMLFMVAALAAEMERDLIRERTLDGLRAAQAQGRRGGRPGATAELSVVDVAAALAGRSR